MIVSSIKGYRLVYLNHALIRKSFFSGVKEIEVKTDVSAAGVGHLNAVEKTTFSDYCMQKRCSSLEP